MSAKQVNDALAGLPYAHGSGRTAITWLWERAIKDPPPEPALRRVTAKDVARPEPEKRPARPFPRRRVEPDPVPKPEALAPPEEPPIAETTAEETIAEDVATAVDEAAPAAAPEAPAGEFEDVSSPPDAAVEAESEGDEVPEAGDGVPEPPAAQSAPGVPPSDLPAPRRRKRQRQVSLPGRDEL
jgi:hypothetical protein